MQKARKVAGVEMAHFPSIRQGDDHDGSIIFLGFILRRHAKKTC